MKECPGALRNCIISWTNATLLYIQSFKENFPVNLRQNSKRKHILPEHEFDRYWMWCNKKMMYRKRCLYIKKGWSFEWIVQKEKLLVWVVRVMNYTSTKTEFRTLHLFIFKSCQYIIVCRYSYTHTQKPVLNDRSSNLSSWPLHQHFIHLKPSI